LRIPIKGEKRAGTGGSRKGMESASVLKFQGSELNDERKVMTYFDVISLVHSGTGDKMNVV
jgi:hypothetical protein